MNLEREPLRGEVAVDDTWIGRTQAGLRGSRQLKGRKVGVPDYKELVTRKVRTAEELYRFMVDQFNQSRAFFLELTVVII